MTRVFIRFQGTAKGVSPGLCNCSRNAPKTGNKTSKMGIVTASKSYLRQVDTIHPYTRFIIRSTNQSVALCTDDYLQDLGSSFFGQTIEG